MALKIFNSLTKAKQTLMQTNTKSSLVTFYVCGPTVYDSAHLGHGRTYVLFDAMRRVLTTICNKEVVYVMNITDVDDKILQKCKHTNESRASLASRFETEFFQDMAQLGVQKPTVCPHATEYIPEMVAFIGRLMNQGYAYRTEDGSVYLDSHLANAKIGYPGVLGKGNELSSEPSSIKRNVSDFALWKSSTELDNVWDCSPFGGMGRPGWHLECSAMIDATIGKIGDAKGGLDIHGGGIDLCFPHHANERCQSQLVMGGDDSSATKPWAQFFCHTGHVTLKRDKMSKSTGNFITLRGLMGKELSPRQLRLLFLSQRRYSASLEWTEGSIARAKALDQQLSDFLFASPEHVTATRLPQEDIDLGEDLALAKQRVHSAMLDDFDFPKVFDIIQHTCKQFTARADSCFAPQARKFVVNTLELLGFGGIDGVQPAYHSVATAAATLDGDVVANDQFIDEVVAFRSAVRVAAKSGNMGAVLAACDKFRNANHGSIIIQDLKDGSSAWKRKV